MRSRPFHTRLRFASLVSLREVLPLRLFPAFVGSLTLAGCALSLGCGLVGKMTGNAARPSSSSAVIPGGPSLSQLGDASAGGKVSVLTSSASLPIPEGSTVEIGGGNATESAVVGGTSTSSGPTSLVRLSKPSLLSSSSVLQTAEGAKTHAPAAPPTPADFATASGVRLFYWLAAAFAVGAVVCFYTSHMSAGLVCAAGAGALPLLASLSAFVASHAAVVFGVCGLSLVVAWYLVKRQEDQK